MDVAILCAGAFAFMAVLLWFQVSRAYRKASGSWTEVSLDQAFQDGVNYVQANP